MYRASFRENHLAFATGLFGEAQCETVQNRSSKPATVGGGMRGSSVPCGNPVERIKCFHFDDQLVSSPGGSVYSGDTGGRSQRHSIRSRVSGTRQRLSSCESTSAMNHGVRALSPLSIQVKVDLENLVDDSTAVPEWTGEEDGAEKCFMTPTRSKVRMLKNISSQRSLLGPRYGYGGAPADENQPCKEDVEDDAIDTSLRPTFQRDIEVDPMYLEDYVVHHIDENLEVRDENLDAISDCTNDDEDV